MARYELSSSTRHCDIAHFDSLLFKTRFYLATEAIRGEGSMMLFQRGNPACVTTLITSYDRKYDDMSSLSARLSRHDRRVFVHRVNRTRTFVSLPKPVLTSVLITHTHTHIYTPNYTSLINCLPFRDKDTRRCARRTSLIRSFVPKQRDEVGREKRRGES